MTIKLELEVDEVNASLAGLSKLPYEVSVAVIDKIRGQALQQVNAPAESFNEDKAGDPQFLTE